jgi:hypothetical protein
MSPIREEYLTLAEVESLICKLEEKHALSTAEFLRNPDARMRLPEDDVFEWDAYIDHRAELRRIDEELRRAFLERVTQVPASETATDDKQLALAA